MGGAGCEDAASVHAAHWHAMPIDDEIAEKLANISDALVKVERTLLSVQASLDAVLSARRAQGLRIGALETRVSDLEQQMAKHLSGLYPAVPPAG